MKSQKILSYIIGLLWLLNPFLVFIAVFDHQLQLSGFVLWLGKLHPLLLHFPIVSGILIAGYFIFIHENRFDKFTEKLVLSINALLSVIVALLGIFLSKGDKYDGTLLWWHQWGGVALAVLSSCWIYLHDKNSFYQNSKAVRIEFSIVYILLIIFFTHKGAQLTHGIDAIAFPNNAASIGIIATDSGNKVNDSTLSVYEKAIQPILNEKCVGCHGPQKTKGGLLLQSPELIKKGGKDGSVFLLEGKSSIIERMHLPITADAHMPPDGKPQLSPVEIAIIEKWILAGGNFDITINKLDKKDSLYQLVNSYSPPKMISKGTAFASLTEYNTNYCNVHYSKPGSNQIEVNFYQGKFYDPAQLKKLIKIKESIVAVSLQTMQLKKEDIEILKEFSNIEKLNLNYTALSLNDIKPILTLKNLKTLSLCGLDFTLQELVSILKGSHLQRVYLWNKNIQITDTATLLKQFPSIIFTIGDNMENQLVKLNNPIIEQDSSIIQQHLDLNIKHVLKGTIIRYTLDGTEPDSVHSPVFVKPMRFTNSTIIKAKAFKEGWLGSEVVQKTLYHSNIHPDTAYFITQPDKKYMGIGAKTLIDYELGEKNFGNGKWLGYKDTHMELVVGFKKPTLVKEAYLNALVNMGSYIFPIVSIQVLGSNDGKHFVEINKTGFAALDKDSPKAMNETQSFYCKINKPAPFKFYKLVVQNLKKLPEWHPGKGTPAWIFMDELFLN